MLIEKFFNDYIFTLQFIATIFLIYKYINNFFKEKNFLQIMEKYESEIFILSENTNRKEVFISNIISMIDSNDCLAMQIKDEYDRYIFANKTLRKMLFNNLSMEEIKNKTDLELITNKTIPHNNINNMIDNLSPKDLINLDNKLLNDSKRVCNITDIITKSFKEPCRFFEIVENLSLDVYKTPIYNGDKLIGTAGSLINITEKKEQKMDELAKMISEGTAFRIGTSDNYYILRDRCYLFTYC